MEITSNQPIQEPSGESILFSKLTSRLLDPLATELAKTVEWVSFSSLSRRSSTNTSSSFIDNLIYEYPIAITGKGPPLLLLHGFDSSFLEFRRLVPFLKEHYQLIIPDLHGFGFGPRPIDAEYGAESILHFLGQVLRRLSADRPVGVLGASMGGAISMEVARRFPANITRLVLLSPAGLTGKIMPLPSPVDKIGVWFLGRPFVRRNLCKQAFYDPKNSVGEKEEQIASLHLSVPGWGRSLASFARSGGIAGFGLPLPDKPINIIWGSNDRILGSGIKRQVYQLLGNHIIEFNKCGHLPHLDYPEKVAKYCLEVFN